MGAFARVEAGRGFIQAEQHRIGAHGARDFEAALRAIGQIAGGIVGTVCQADSVQPLRARSIAARSAFAKEGKPRTPRRV